MPILINHLKFAFAAEVVGDWCEAKTYWIMLYGLFLITKFKKLKLHFEWLYDCTCYQIVTKQDGTLMCMTNRNKYLPSSLDYINKTSEYSVVQKQYEHTFNGGPHITVMNAFPNKNTVGSYSMSRHVLHWEICNCSPRICYEHCSV